MERPWIDIEREQPLALVETGEGEIAVEYEDLPDDEQGDLDVGKRARILADQFVLVRYDDANR